MEPGPTGVATYSLRRVGLNIWLNQLCSLHPFFLPAQL